jgi:hypothetical protein
MEDLLEWFRTEGWKNSIPSVLQARQLMKALYWVSEEDKQDHGGYGFGQLITRVEYFTVRHEEFKN